MFKTLKYLFLASLYKKAKKSLLMLCAYVVSLILFSFMINDVINVATGGIVYILLPIKWIVILSLLGLIAFSVLKIFNIASNPFESKDKKRDENTKQTPSGTKKERILAKEKLFTQSDLILQKYIKD
jgi:L-lactate permease